MDEKDRKQLEDEFTMGFRMQSRGLDASTYVHARRALGSELIEAYESTRFVVTINNEKSTVTIGKSPRKLISVLEKHGWKNFIFITAWNPWSQQLSENENNQQNIILKQSLLDHGLACFDACGISADGKWREPSFFVPNVDYAFAEDLGYQLKQNALVFCEPPLTPELWFFPKPENLQPQLNAEPKKPPQKLPSSKMFRTGIGDRRRNME